MSAYWSYGGGVNSTAGIILTLTDDRFADLRGGLRVVFCDTGAEMPETLCYVQYFGAWLKREHGIEMEYLRPAAGDLITYCHRYQIIPSRLRRWCTREFKVGLLEPWAASLGADTALIGFDAGEMDRADKRTPYDNPRFTKRYPLIEADIDRAGCLRIIAATGLELPRKSGCFCCPFGSKKHYEDLQTYHPDLFQQACDLEETGQGFARGFYLKDKPLREWLQNPGLELYEPCVVCELTDGDASERGEGR